MSACGSIWCCKSRRGWYDLESWSLQTKQETVTRSPRLRDEEGANTWTNDEDLEQTTEEPADDTGTRSAGTRDQEAANSCTNDDEHGQRTGELGDDTARRSTDIEGDQAERQNWNIPEVTISKTLNFPNLVADLAESNSEFALDLFRLVTTDDENVLFSPYSILSVFSMAYLGAQNNTASQMSSALRLDGISDEVHQAFQDFILLITAPSAGYKLSTANKIYARKDKILSSKFLEKIHEHYMAEAELCDFGGDPDGVSKNINHWVEEQTNNKIKDIVSPEAFTEDTSLLLINAIYFKGNWTSKFEEMKTRKEDFSMSSLETCQVDMMHQKGDFNFGHFDKLECQLLEMPYVGYDVSMVILLPDEVDGLENLESSVTADDLMDTQSYMFLGEVEVSLPKFKIESSFQLSDALKALGMTDAFEEGTADFGGIDPSGLVTVSEAYHKAFVNVNEEGTEAAACTVIDSFDCFEDSEPSVFKADHPFLFFIKDTRSNMMMFLGRIYQPTY